MGSTDDAAPKPNRRDFLAQAMGLGVLLSTPARLLAQERLPTRMIPSTGEPIPVVGFGSSKPVLESPVEGTEPIANVLRMLLDYGGRVIDTSPRTEAIDRDFGRVLQDPEVRDRLFLAAKININGEQDGIDQWRQTQRLFGRRTVDLLQVESLRDVDLHWPNVRAWKDSGEARYIGVTVSSNFQHTLMETFMRENSPDFVHVNYSPYENAAEESLLPLARDMGMGVLINRPFMNGTYFGRVAGKGASRMGRGVRLRDMGAVLAQVCAGESRRDLRPDRNDQPRTHGREHSGRVRASSG